MKNILINNRFGDLVFLRRVISGLLSLTLVSLAPMTMNRALAHGTESHDDGVSANVDSDSGAGKLPINVGGEFELIDHNGNQVTNQSYSGKHMLVFFGYASCKNMCSLTLSRVGKALELLGEGAEKLSPIVITVDPDRDTPAVMKSELANYHPGLIGHTGDTQQLEKAYSNFNQNPKSAGKDWDNDPIISHSSYIYLMDQQGNFATLFPPILNPQSMADIIGKYVNFPS